MDQDELHPYLKRILGHINKIAEVINSMTTAIDIEGNSDNDKVNISNEARDKIKKVNQ